MTTREELRKQKNYEFYIAALFVLSEDPEQLLANLKNPLVAYGANLSPETAERIYSKYYRRIEIMRRRRAGETLESVGNSFGLTRERVRQLEFEFSHRAKLLNPDDYGNAIRFNLKAAKKQRQIESYLQKRKQLHYKPKPKDWLPPGERIAWSSYTELILNAHKKEPNPKEYLYKYSKEEALYWFNYSKDELGRVPTLCEVSLNGKLRSSNLLWERYWGGWNEFLMSQGYLINSSKKRPELMRQCLVENYLRVKQDLGRVPLRSELARLGHYKGETYCLHYGNYHKFLEQIGDLKEFEKLHSLQVWSYEKIKVLVLELAEKLRRTPSLRDLQNAGLYKSILYKRIGSYSAFCSELGLKPNKPNSKVYVELSGKKIQETFKNVMKDLGRQPNKREFCQLSGIHEYKISAKFGSYENLLAEFGLKRLAGRKSSS